MAKTERRRRPKKQDVLKSYFKAYANLYRQYQKDRKFLAKTFLHMLRLLHKK